MKPMIMVLAIALLVSGCTSTRSVSPDMSRPSEPLAQTSDDAHKSPGANLGDWHALDILEGLSVRDVVSDSTGKQFIVQDQSMSLFLVSATGKIQLGKAPDIGLLAAWGENDFGYAFARKSETGKSYEIVGVGHEGNKVLAETVGYPGALQFVGQEVHFIDAEGWKVVKWSGSPILKAPLSLGPRANQRAWCVWSKTGPLCIGGYWDPTTDSSIRLTVVRAGEPGKEIVPKGPYPILEAGAFSSDGRLLAASLGARSTGAISPGNVVVAWLDEAGVPEKTKEFPILAKEIAFDAYGRLIIHLYPPDGAGNGSIAILNTADGTTVSLTMQTAAGPYSFTMSPDRKQLYILPVGGGASEVLLAAP